MVEAMIKRAAFEYLLKCCRKNVREFLLRDLDLRRYQWIPVFIIIVDNCGI
jgi:hypothetical protein